MSKARWAQAHPETCRAGLARKSAFLGMPFGTAQNRLRKMLMFRLAQAAGMDFCYRCDNKIESADELSIDHKIAWLHVSVDLFWDLDNIAFAHRRCNKRGC